MSKLVQGSAVRTLPACTALAVASLLALCSGASAQLARPGAHGGYAAEVEPHLVVQWAHEPFCNDDGLGLGGRASFPVLPNGPIPTINNSLALGVGLDLAFFDGDCWRPINDNYDATDIWIPFDVQWNLYFSQSFSGFIELGLGIQHSSWNCAGGACGDGSDTDLHAVLWLGGRYQFSPAMAVTMRLGVPSFLLGLSFFV